MGQIATISMVTMPTALSHRPSPWGETCSTETTPSTLVENSSQVEWCQRIALNGKELRSFSEMSLFRCDLACFGASFRTVVTGMCRAEMREVIA